MDDGGYDLLCVQVIDSETLSAHGCEKLNFSGEWPPSERTPDCVDVGTSTSAVSISRELLERAKRLPGMRKAKDVTYLIPTDRAMHALGPNVLAKLRSNAAERDRFLDRHTRAGIQPWRKLDELQLPPLAVDRPCPDGMTHLVGATVPGP